MGFFSSRKTDADIIVHDYSRTTAVVQVLRSRFHGKNKASPTAKETFIPNDSTTASALSHPNLRKSQSTPFSSSLRKVGPSALRNKLDPSSSNSLRAPEIENPIILGSGVQHEAGTSRGLPSDSKTHGSSTLATASARPHEPSQTPSASASARASIATDTVTMTLAQRLNELAVANGEGFLSDDDYRLLRQNLFERFAGNVTIPTEKSIVPAQVGSLGKVSDGRTSVASSRLSSHFDVNTSTEPFTKSPSIRSIRSGVASILHRTAKRGSNRDRNDTASIYSVNSTTSSVLPSQTRVGSVRSIKRKTSDSSLGARADGSRKPHSDTFSLSSRTSRKTGHPERSPSDGCSPHTPSRSASSVRRLAVPPSSFSAKGLNVHSEHKHERLQDLFDDSVLVTSADIKKELAAVEAEGKRLMDAFNGLEVTTLANKQRGHHRQDSRSVTILGDVSGTAASWTLAPDTKMHFRPNLQLDTDMVSIRSGTSAHTARSGRSLRRGEVSASSTSRMPPPPLPKKSSYASISASGGGGVSLHRKNSSSSMGSSVAASKLRNLTPASSSVPVSTIPSSLGNLGRHASASNSSVNLARSTGHLPMSSVPEHEVQTSTAAENGEVDDETEEIRRRRAEVSRRYEQRLEYLRAKLKGAQLHEKLMKK